MTLDQLFDRAAAAYGTTRDEMTGPRIPRNLVNARDAVAWALRQGGRSYPTIARVLGRQDHTSAIAMVRRAVALRASDAGFRALTDGMIA